MIPFSFQAFTDSGCLVIFDPGSRFEATNEWLDCLNHATDPDGRICLASDHAEGGWPAVWRQKVRRLRELGHHGEFTLLFCDEVEYACRVSDDLMQGEAPRLRVCFEEWVHAPSGRLVIGDAMAAFSGLAMEDEPFADLSVTPGWNKVRVQSLEEPSDFDHIEGFEGSEECPSLVFNIEAAADMTAKKSKDAIFPRVTTKRHRSAGHRCKATVTIVENGVAKLQLHASRSTRRGHGRLRLPEPTQVSAGDCVLVRLVEDKTSYWLVEMT